MKYLILLMLITIPFLGSTNKLEQNPKIIYSFGQAVDSLLRVNFFIKYKELRIDVDSTDMDKYTIFIMLDKDDNCENYISYWVGDDKSEFCALAKVSSIFFKVNEKITVPIITNYDISFNEKHKFRGTWTSHGHIVRFDDNGNLIK